MALREVLQACYSYNSQVGSLIHPQVAKWLTMSTIYIQAQHFNSFKPYHSAKCFNSSKLSPHFRFYLIITYPKITKTRELNHFVLVRSLTRSACTK